MNTPAKVILDTNVLLLYIIGRLSPHNIHRHRRTSIYTIEHYHKLNCILENAGSGIKLILCPNITTEVDNLLNNTFHGEDKTRYVALTKMLYDQNTEVYKKSLEAARQHTYYNLGLTDTIVLLMAKDCDLLISGDSLLCDYARSMDIRHIDFKKIVNDMSYR